MKQILGIGAGGHQAHHESKLCIKTRLACRMADSHIRPILGCLLLLMVVCLPARAADRQWLPSQMPSAATNASLLRPSPRWENLNLTIGLPLRNRAALTNLLQQLYDPASPNYHHFLTPDQFAQRFGPTPEDYEAVVNFARAHGLAALPLN